jgi:hypothetical protein
MCLDARKKKNPMAWIQEFLWLGASLILVGCSNLLEEARPSSVKILTTSWARGDSYPPTNPLYSYRTLGKPTFYANPLPNGEERLQGAYQPPSPPISDTPKRESKHQKFLRFQKPGPLDSDPSPWKNPQKPHPTERG